MPVLEFKGKHHIYAHHLSVPYRQLKRDESRSCNPSSEEDNLIIHGDNLHALKALLPHYADRVKCIYIDPPYNTGNEGMKEQQIPPNIRINNAIDQDIRDAKINLNLIERVTDPSDLSQTLVFSTEELQTLIRNCVHAVILNLTKTIEKPIIHEERIQTYNLESLIDGVCHDDDINSLKNEVQRIRGNKIYGKLVEYRHKIIAHRNVEYGEYEAIEQEFTECKDYLLKHKGQIEKLIDKINDLQMNIKDSRLKKTRVPSWSIYKEIN